MEVWSTIEEPGVHLGSIRVYDKKIESVVSSIFNWLLATDELL
jgi:hypothetical protein